MKKKVDILLPCLNEEITLLKCIKSINKVMNKYSDIYDYQIVVCDNGSTDNSIKIAKKAKAKVLIEDIKGYGATLLNGINNSSADYIVMLDCDLSYNEKDIPRFLYELDSGYELVVGNRFMGNIEKGAMPVSHFYGSRLLTLYANILFHTPCRDFHCGLRAFDRESIIICKLRTNGFEFASEMIVRAKAKNLKIKEISTDLFIDGRDRKPHLKAIRDGIRHLLCITYCKIDTSIKFRYFILIIFILLLFSLIILVNHTFDNKTINKNIDLSIKYLNSNKSFKFIDTNSDISTIKNNSNNNLLFNGSYYILRFILLFGPINNMFYIISIIIISIISLINIYKLFRLSVRLSISYLIYNILFFLNNNHISINSLFNIILVLIFTNIIIIMVKRNYVQYGLIFSLFGSFTCFFSSYFFNLNTLIIPILIYYFLLSDKNRNNINKLYNYIILYFLFYIFFLLLRYTYIYLFIDKKIFINIFNQLYNYNSTNIIKAIFINIKTSINSLLPLNIIYLYLFIIFIYLILVINYSIVFKNNNFFITIMFLPMIKSVIFYNYYFINSNLLYIDYYGYIFIIIIFLLYSLIDYIELFMLKRLIK